MIRLLLLCRLRRRGVDGAGPYGCGISLTQPDHCVFWVVDLWLEFGDVWEEALPRRLRNGGLIDVIAVLFTQVSDACCRSLSTLVNYWQFLSCEFAGVNAQGVNEWQTTGNMYRNNRIQHVVNVGSLMTMSLYAARCASTDSLPQQSLGSARSASASGAAQPRKLSRKLTLHALVCGMWLLIRRM